MKSTEREKAEEDGHLKMALRQVRKRVEKVYDEAAQYSDPYDSGDSTRLAAISKILLAIDACSESLFNSGKKRKGMR